ncbi:MAG: hypothetical protein AAGI34_05995 [Pseudomonadota bacterium]
MTKSAFARHIGSVPSRVTQMLADGMPVLPSGRIPREEALAWIEANVNRHEKPSEGDRARLARLKADLAQLDLDQRSSKLIDRAEAERTIFEIARAERDAHLAFVARAAPVIAAQIGCDGARLFSALDAAMREHLADLRDPGALA